MAIIRLLHTVGSVVSVSCNIEKSRMILRFTISAKGNVEADRFSDAPMPVNGRVKLVYSTRHFW